MSVSFTNNADLLSTASAVVTGPPFTVSLWYNGNTSTAERRLFALDTGDAVTSEQWCVMLLATTSLATWRARSGGTNQDAQSIAPTVGTWQHFCGIEESATSRAMFVDGGNKATNLISKSPTGVTTTCIGNRSALNSNADGLVSHVAVWDVVLTDAEVARLAGGANPQVIRPASLIYYKPLTIIPSDMTVAGTPTNSGDFPPVDAYTVTKMYANSDIQALNFVEKDKPQEGSVRVNDGNDDIMERYNTYDATWNFANYDSDVTGTYLRDATGQSFIANGETIKRVQLMLKKLGTPTGTFTCSIYAHSGTYGVDGIPTGSPLGTSQSVNIANMSTNYRTLEFDFSGVATVKGTPYYIVLDMTGLTQDINNKLIIGYDASSAFGGTSANKPIAGSWTADATNDWVFNVLSHSLPNPTANGMSVGFWMYRDGVKAVDSNPFETKRNTATSPAANSQSVYLQIKATDSSMRVGYFSGGGGSGFGTFPNVPAPNTWIYFALTAETGTSNVKGYWWDIGGDANTATTTLVDVGAWIPDVLHLGTNYLDPTYQVNGKYCQFRAWDRVLTQAELAAERDSPTPIILTGLNSAWVDDPRVDTSGNGNSFRTRGLETIYGAIPSPILPATIPQSMRMAANGDVQVGEIIEREGMQYDHGRFLWKSAYIVGETIRINTGFEPKAIRLFSIGSGANTANGTINTAHSRRSTGFAVSPTERRSVASYSAFSSNPTDCGSAASDTAVLLTVDGTGTIDGNLDISVMDANGFTVIVDDAAPVDMTVHYEAWGGNDITIAAVGDAAEPATTGTQDYTVTGFTAGGTDQVVMFGGVQSTAALNSGSATDSGFCIGFTTGPDSNNNIVIVGNSDDATTPVDSDAYCRNGNCLAMIVVAGGTTLARANLDSYISNGFRLNWTNVLTANRRNIWMAIKGGQWVANSFVFNASSTGSTASVTGLPFKPIGMTTIGLQGGESSNTAGQTDAFNSGSASDHSSQQNLAVRDQNNITASRIELVENYSGIWTGIAAGNAGISVDLVGFTADGFDLVVGSSDPGGVTTSWCGYLTYAPTSTVYPPKLYANGTYSCPQFIEA